MTDKATLTRGTRPPAIAAAALITPDAVLQQPVVFLRDGQVERITSRDAVELPEGTLHLPDCTLAPGFLDVHVHGAGGRDVMEGTPDAISTVARTLAGYGTTQFLATTVTAGTDETLRSLQAIARAISNQQYDDEAALIGVHLEGPFLSHNKRGVHPPDRLQPPSINLFERFNAAANGSIRLLTIAPELPGAADLIRHVSAQGVRVSIGHSDALAADARAGIAAGAVSATHTFNAMRGLTQREPGILGVVLDAQELFAELICDGIHTTPEAVRLWFRAKGEEHAILITDGMAATGMPDGEYLLGGLMAQVKDGVATHDGVLAGSVLTMDRAVANVRTFTGCNLPTAIRLATRNPRRMLELRPDETTADFNIYNTAAERIGGILRGTVL